MAIDDNEEETTLPGIVSQQLELLQEISLFRGLSLKQWFRIVNASKTMFYDTGECVLSQGDLLDSLNIVIDGALESDAASAPLQRGAVFVASSLLHHHAARWSASASVPTTVMRLSSKDFLTLTHSQPRLGLALLHRLGEHLSRALNSVTSSPFSS